MSKSGVQNPNIEIRNPKVCCKLTGENKMKTLNPNITRSISNFGIRISDLSIQISFEIF
jgi:hypothetical protein